MNYIIIFLTLIIFFLAVMLIRLRLARSAEPKGFLIILEDPDDGPYLFLESSVSIEELKASDKVTFVVKIRTPQNKQSL